MSVEPSGTRWRAADDLAVAVGEMPRVAVIGNTLRRLAVPRTVAPGEHVVRGYAQELLGHLIVLVQCRPARRDEEEWDDLIGEGLHLLLGAFSFADLSADHAWERTRRLGVVTERLLVLWCRRGSGGPYVIEAESDGTDYCVIDEAGSYAHRAGGDPQAARHLPIARAHRLAEDLNTQAVRQVPRPTTG
ncbi:hypothetical protein GCM10010400_29160 [Streptomyces aculeolatus]|uniref:hypothetical protein n=1 Tax=Streptomyces aculeolatus TaxID=270689 RepID=UPI001CECE336|nr:hypothetical protein [Streptomyces aculeolatus]